jgi:CrcB protein
MEMRELLAVGLGGAIGSVLRHAMNVALLDRAAGSGFPLSTMLVNLTGCLLIGVIVQAHQAEAISATGRLFLVTGLLGGLTTFSTFGHDTLRVAAAHGWRLAVANVAANVLLGLAAVAIGIGLGRGWWPKG